MQVKFNVTKEEKKKLIGFISEQTGYEVVYNRVPLCSYSIGPFELDRNNCLNWDNADAELLIERLSESDFDFEVIGTMETREVKKPVVIPEPVEEEPKISGVEISLPRSNFNDEALENLRRLISAKGELMKRAFECDELELIIDEEKITFPWFKPGTSVMIKAYTDFTAALGNMAINQKRISAKPKDIVNEKYEFRCFLLRLGFIGDEFKDTRKILLTNLSGSAAFKSGQRGGQA